MAKLITIQKLEERVRWQIDQERANLRHTSEDLRENINLSISRFREKVSDNGHPYYLTSHSSTLATGSMVDANNGDVSFPWGKLDINAIEPAVVRIYGIDVRVGDRSYPLQSVEFNERNELQDEYGFSSIPLAFFGINEKTLGILPVPVTPYPFTLWYLPEQPDLVEDDDEFNPCVPGAEQWVIWDVVLKLCVRDHYMDKVPLIMAERDKVWIDIQSRISKHSRVGCPRRIDTRGMRARSRVNSYWWS